VSCYEALIAFGGAVGFIERRGVVCGEGGIIRRSSFLLQLLPVRGNETEPNRNGSLRGSLEERGIPALKNFSISEKDIGGEWKEVIDCRVGDRRGGENVVGETRGKTGLRGEGGVILQTPS